MGRILTLGTLVTRAQQRCDLENSSLISTTEWKGMVSSVYGEHYSILVQSGLRYYETATSIASGDLSSDGAGGASIALPSTYLSTLGVDRQQGTRWHPLEEIMIQERNDVTYLTGSRGLYYATIGANLHIYPEPGADQAYRHVHIPQPADLSAGDDADNVDVVTPDGEQFITWGVAVMALAKEESDPSMAMAERERFRARVEQWANLRALTTPRRPQVVDEYESFNRHRWDGGYR
jgi:hypothetical protein